MIHSILLEQNYQGRFYFGNHKTIISTCTVVVVLVKANLLVILKSEIGKFGLIHFCFKARLTSSIYPYFFSFPCNPFFHVPLIFIFILPRRGSFIFRSNSSDRTTCALFLN